MQIGYLIALCIAVGLIAGAQKEGTITLAHREMEWLDKIDAALDAMPDDEGTLLGEMADTYGHRFQPSSYGL